jgi:hypothetical protein
MPVHFAGIFDDRTGLIFGASMLRPARLHGKLPRSHRQVSCCLAGRPAHVLKSRTSDSRMIALAPGLC